MKAIRLYLILFIVVVMAVGMVASIWLKPERIAQLGLTQTESKLLGTASCDAARTPCTLKTKQKSISLTLQPPVKSLTPFEIRLRSEGVDAEAFVITFTMVGMEMGLNRYALKRGGEVWRGRAMLPVCTENRKDWLATVSFVEDGKAYRAEFPFTSQ